MKVKKNGVWYRIGILCIVIIIVFIVFKYTPLNTIFDVYEGLRLSYDNVSVDVDESRKDLPNYIKTNLNEINKINNKKTVLVPNTASSIRNDCSKLLPQLLKIKNNIENTYPHSISELKIKHSSGYKEDESCPTKLSDIANVYTTIIFVNYYLQGIINISDVKTDANQVVEICIGENTGLRYYLKRLIEYMNNYIGMANQVPVSGNGQKIITDFKNSLGQINRLLYQVEDIITHNSGDTNGYINKIKEFVHNFGTKTYTIRLNHYNSKSSKTNNNEHILPSGVKLVRKGKCYASKCSFNNK